MAGEDLAELIAGLQQPDAYPHPTGEIVLIETHISHILLAGDYAYKLKKPLDLGFLDFSTLERRRHCCEEELRLNRRLAADLYIEVVAITGTAAMPRVNGPGAAIEYAVRMHRFAQSQLLDRQVPHGAVIDALARTVAGFHASIPVADPSSHYGTLPMVLEPMLENLRAIRTYPRSNPQVLDHLEAWTRARARDLAEVIEQRRGLGFVRECHGDMHRGNIVLIAGEPRIFDAIEFNPDLRWIDTISEIAFFIMDLEANGQHTLARRFLNRYLETSGDYTGLAVLDFYKVYRALVRAKVLAIRLGQPGIAEAQQQEARCACGRYLTLALGYTRPRRPRLFIACGLSGTGKSRLACRLREQWDLIHLRSDVERKRLFGLPHGARTYSKVDSGIYFPAATDWTYDRLHRLAGRILDSGYDVLVDATFLTRHRRARFCELARRQRAGFLILALDAPHETLRRRIMRRLVDGRDPSDADLLVLERQRADREPLTEEELARTLLIDTSASPVIEPILREIAAMTAARGQRVQQDPQWAEHRADPFQSAWISSR